MPLFLFRNDGCLRGASIFSNAPDYSLAHPARVIGRQAYQVLLAFTPGGGEFGLLWTKSSSEGDIIDLCHPAAAEVKNGFKVAITSFQLRPT